jgi:hypothetical protein
MSRMAARATRLKAFYGSPSWFFLAAAVGLLDGLTTLTGVMNFAHHEPRHAISALIQSVGWTALAICLRQRRPASADTSEH